MPQKDAPDQRILEYLQALQDIREERYDVDIPLTPADDISKLGRAIKTLGRDLKQKITEFNQLCALSQKMHHGFELDTVLDQVYTSFTTLIPYNRIGVAHLEEEGRVVRSFWQSSDSEQLKLKTGYQSPLKGSSLAKIISDQRPRIINDLRAYLEQNPRSRSTQLIVAEGMRSNLTFPLYAFNKPIGFIFFASRQKHTYDKRHIGLFQHLSHQLSAIIEKSRLYKRLQDLDELKNQFLGIAVHDLKSPIGIIKSYVTMGKQGYLGQINDKQEQALDVMERNCDRMLTLIRDLLDYSVIESGELTINKKKSDLQELVENYYHDHQTLAVQKKINFKCEIRDSLPEIAVDRNRMEQVIDNFVTNAIKYSDPDTEIVLSVQVRDHQIEVVVSDQGPGIDPDKIDRLFTKFGKVGSKPTGKEKSTGLGLFIAKKIIEAHGGSIHVKSKPGEGSRFYFLLPIN